MYLNDGDAQLYESFIRRCGLEPQHNYFLAEKYLHPLVKTVMSDAIGAALTTQTYLLVFTSKAVLLKRIKNFFSEDQLTTLTDEQHLWILDPAEITELQVKPANGISGFPGSWLSFKYQGKPYYFYHEGGRDQLIADNFHYLLQDKFNGLLMEE